jgi:hypothetical protein
MKKKTLGTIMLALLTASFGQSSAYALVGTAFSYQGELRQGGSPVVGTADLQFSLFAVPSGGASVAGPITINNVTPTADGRFTVSLDFGANVFDGSERYLEIAVRSPAGSGFFTILSPRQRLAPTPYALQTRGIFVNSVGNIGIGTTTPAANLELSKTDATLRLTSTGSSGTSTLDLKGVVPGGLTSNTLGALRFLDDSDTVRSQIFAGTGLLSSPLNFWVDGSTQMVLTSNGNLGVGTGLPVAKVQLVGGTDSELGSGGFLVLGETNTANISIDNNEIMARNNGVASTLFLNNDGGDVSIVPNGGGQVGIGTAPTSSTLTVFNSLFINGGASPRLDIGPNGFILLDTGADITITDGGLQVNTPSGGNTFFNRTSPDGTLISFHNNGTAAGGIAVFGTTVTYNAFTGSHYAWTDESIEPGSLVTLTGENRRPHDGPNVELVYGVTPCAKANDPACLGAYLSLEEPSQAGEPRDPLARHLVAAVGNGEMFVTDSAGGNIRPGDYLISSDVLGCAMKDDTRRFPVGNVVARAAEAVDWSTIQANESGVKRARISVFFESFVRHAEAIQLADTIEKQQSQIDSLIRQLASMQNLTERLAKLESQQTSSTATASLIKSGD